MTGRWKQKHFTCLGLEYFQFFSFVFSQEHKGPENISPCFALTWHLIGRVCRLSGLRCGEAGAVAEACLQRRLTLSQTAFRLNAGEHHAEVCHHQAENESLFSYAAIQKIRQKAN